MQEFFRIDRDDMAMSVLDFSDVPAFPIGITLAQRRTQIGNGIAITRREALLVAEALLRCVASPGAPNPPGYPAAFQARNAGGQVNEMVDRLFQLESLVDELREAGAFLRDRLREFENELQGEEAARQFHGHVLPALARLEGAVQSKGSADA